MRVHSFFDGGYASMSYLVTDDAGQHGVLIDPSVTYDRAVREYGSLPKIEALLLTHGHFDHILTLDEWREKTGAPVYVSGADSSMLTNARLSCFYQFFGENRTFAPAEHLLKDGEKISFGDTSLTVMLTAGHTAGSCVYIGDGVLFTGDTVFADGGYGRTDLPSGSESALWESIRRIFSLGEHYRIYPGHGRDSTLKDEKHYHYL